MAKGTGIYIPPEMLGDETADETTFLRGDSTWATPDNPIDTEALLNLLAHAFQRIMFLEAALKISYKKKDLEPPDEFALIEDKLEWM